MATARELLCQRLNLPISASAVMVAQSVEHKDPDRSSAWRMFIAKQFPDVGAELGVQARQDRRMPFKVTTSTQASQASSDAEHASFMQQWFPELKAAARYGIPGGPLGDSTPLSQSPSATPATNPPTGWVHRPPQEPNSHPPAAYTGPARPVATPSTSTIPLASPPPPLTDAERHARRVGGTVKPDAPPFDITQRRGPGRTGFARA